MVGVGAGSAAFVCCACTCTHARVETPQRMREVAMDELPELILPDGDGMGSSRDSFLFLIVVLRAVRYRNVRSLCVVPLFPLQFPTATICACAMKSSTVQ